jgi:hypothetical protein
MDEPQNKKIKNDNCVKNEKLPLTSYLWQSLPYHAGTLLVKSGEN